MLKSKLLSNKYVLYFLLVFSIITILGYIESNNFVALAIFMATGYITSNFTKNMILVLTAGILVSGCKICINILSENLLEGFKEGNKNKAATATNKGGILFTVQSQASPKDCKKVNKKETECKEHCDKSKGCDPKKAQNCYGCKDWNTHCDKSKPRFCKGKRSGFANMMDVLYGKRQEGFGNMVDLIGSIQKDTPKRLKQTKEMMTTATGHMSALDRMLGTKNFAGMADAHSKLIGNQKNLLESLTSMKPIIEGVKEKLEIAKTIDNKKLVKLISRYNNNELPGLMAKQRK